MKNLDEIPHRLFILIQSEYRSEMEIGLVSCTKSKKNTASKPKDLYMESALFRKARRYAEHHHDTWKIISAKHHLLDPFGSSIEPYDETLNSASVEEKKRWSKELYHQLEQANLLQHKLVFHAGKGYYEYLTPLLKDANVEYVIPTEGLSQGTTLRWYNVDRFYRLMEKLKRQVGGMRRLADCDGYMDWPQRGVYFFFSSRETSEVNDFPRIERVGTHAVRSDSSTELWDRLKQHYGTGSRSKEHPHGGDHRGSVFRKRVGQAIISRDYSEREVPDWSEKSIPSNRERSEVKDEEYPVEKDVSTYIRHQSFLWVKVDDPPGKNSDRAKIESNAIALLSNYDGNSIDARNDEWLGKESPKKEIRESGLWNVNHVQESYSSDFLDLLEEKVKQTTETP